MIQEKNLIKKGKKRGGAKLKILITSALCVLAIAVIVSAATLGFSVALRQRQSAKSCRMKNVPKRQTVTQLQLKRGNI
jgi:flagellar basal body-associated protein FliL